FEGRIDGQPFRNARREVEQLESSIADFDLRPDDVRVDEVLLRDPCGLVEDEGKAATHFTIEEAREHRRTVETGQTEPVDARIRTDQTKDPAVADRGVIEMRLHG